MFDVRKVKHIMKQNVICNCNCSVTLFDYIFYTFSMVWQNVSLLM